MRNHPHPTSPRETALHKFNAARHNLLVMIAFTLINLVLLAVDSGTMFLFSASIPYISVAIGMVSGISALLTVCIGIAAVSLVLYFLCWLLSKKHWGWLIVALILFLLDTLFLVGFYLLAQEFSGILDFLIHIWVLYYLIIGVKYGAQLKKLPEDAPSLEIHNSDDDRSVPVDSTPLRIVDDNVKFRVLLEGDHLGHHICYRRVKRVNQLVIDSYIYSEMEMLLERAHELTAVIDGHTITVGHDGHAYSFLSINGTTVARKARLI